MIIRKLLSALWHWVFIVPASAVVWVWNKVKKTANRLGWFNTQSYFLAKFYNGLHFLFTGKHNPKYLTTIISNPKEKLTLRKYNLRTTDPKLINVVVRAIISNPDADTDVVFYWWEEALERAFLIKQNAFPYRQSQGPVIREITESDSNGVRVIDLLLEHPHFPAEEYESQKNRYEYTYIRQFAKL